MGGKAVPASGVGGGGMNNGAMERTSGTGAFDDVHPWDSAMQGSNPSAGRASNPAGPGGGDIDWVGQPAGSSGKRKNPWGSGDRVPPRGPWSSLRFNNKPCREKSVGSSELPAFHAEPKHRLPQRNLHPLVLSHCTLRPFARPTPPQEAPSSLSSRGLTTAPSPRPSCHEGQSPPCPSRADAARCPRGPSIPCPPLGRERPRETHARARHPDCA